MEIFHMDGFRTTVLFDADGSSACQFKNDAEYPVILEIPSSVIAGVPDSGSISAQAWRGNKFTLGVAPRMFRSLFRPYPSLSKEG
jgi:hypothetical protein